MTVLLAYIRTPEGDAALGVAVREAKLRSTDAVVVNVTRPEAEVASPFSTEQELDAVVEVFAQAGVAAEIRQLSAGTDSAEAIVEVAAQVHPELVIIGLRRRSEVGKFILGSTSQRILLGVDCPVVAVKALPE